MAPVSSLPPGFRFHPTDEELVAYYLKRKINGHNIELEVIPEVDLYKCEPWDLPGKSLLPSKDLEWYFFGPRDRKYPNGSRTNRATKAGYWKATGKDRKVNSQTTTVGMKKTLVYYRGRAPHGARTDWIMHEYRLDETQCEIPSGLQDSYALCRVFKKVCPTGVLITKINNNIDHEYDCYNINSNNNSSNNQISISISDHSASTINVNNDDAGVYNNVVNPSFALSSPSTSYPPSKVIARMQQQFWQHPLMEVHDFPQNGFNDILMPHSSSMSRPIIEGRDIVDEILSVAHEASDLHHDQNSCRASTGYDINDVSSSLDFSFNPYANATMIHESESSSRLMENVSSYNNLYEEFKTEKKPVENLRWVGISNNYLNFEEEYKCVPVQHNIMSSFQKRDNQFDDHNKDVFDELLNGFIECEDDFTRTPSFDQVHEKVEMNHGLFVSTCQVAETFFHQIIPSQVVKVIYLNPTSSSCMMAQSNYHPVPDQKLAECGRKNLKLLVETILKPIMKLMAIILSYCLYKESINLNDFNCIK